MVTQTIVPLLAQGEVISRALTLQLLCGVSFASRQLDNGCIWHQHLPKCLPVQSPLSRLFNSCTQIKTLRNDCHQATCRIQGRERISPSFNCKWELLAVQFRGPSLRNVNAIYCSARGIKAFLNICFHLKFRSRLCVAFSGCCSVMMLFLLMKQEAGKWQVGIPTKCY